MLEDLRDRGETEIRPGLGGNCAGRSSISISDSSKSALQQSELPHTEVGRIMYYDIC